MAGEPLTFNVVPKTIGDDPQDLANWIYAVALELEKTVETDLTASNGVILVGTDIQHGDTSSISNVDTSGAQVVDTITFDTFGHVLTFTTRDLTASDIGAQVQDDTLDGIAATDPTTDQINYFTGTNVASVTSLTAFARTLIDDTTQGAMQTTLNVDPAGTDNSTNVTLAGVFDYLTLSGQQITLNAIDLTTDVSGDLPVADGGTGSSTAGGARTNLDVDQAGTDNSTNVTLDGTPNYITIVGQLITRALISLTSHVTGILPLANGGTNDAAVTSANIGHLKAMNQDVAVTSNVAFGTITASGNVTISNASSPMLEIIDTTNTNTFRIIAGNTVAILGTTSTHRMLIQTNGSDAIEINATTQAVSIKNDFTVESSNEVFLNLPTVSTGTSGSLWNDSGTVKVVP